MGWASLSHPDVKDRASRGPSLLLMATNMACPPVTAPGRRRGKVPGSGGALVLVDDAAQEIVANYPPSVVRPGAGLGHRQVAASMRAALVVLTDVLANDRLEVPTRADQEVVEAVLSGTAPPSARRTRSRAAPAPECATL